MGVASNARRILFVKETGGVVDYAPIAKSENDGEGETLSEPHALLQSRFCLWLPWGIITLCIFIILFEAMVIDRMSGLSIASHQTGSFSKGFSTEFGGWTDFSGVVLLTCLSDCSSTYRSRGEEIYRRTGN
jgi:hypothetical protein